MSVTVDTSQINALAASFDANAARMESLVRTVVQKSCTDMKGDAKILAPVDTGNLRSSIGYETRELASAVEGVVGPTADYGEFVENGTSRMAAQPYMAPAFDRHVDAFLQACAQINAGTV